MTESVLEAAPSAASAATKAFAKINLTLQVIGPRSDGYHEIRSFVAGVDLADEVYGTTNVAGTAEVCCDDPSLSGPGNLAHRAAVRLADFAGVSPSLRLQIRKRIPVGGGMGGGSSDGAAALRICRTLWGLDVSDGVLASVGAELGSDVPLFFHLPSAVVSGRGEIVESRRMCWTGWAVLVAAGSSVSTPEVYRTWRREECPEVGLDLEDRVANARSAAELMALSRNDLEPAVFRVSSETAGVFSELNRRGLGPIRVSGAGSVMYRLFDDIDEARAVAAIVRDWGMNIRTEVVAVPAGPAPVLCKERMNGDY